jgi:hypothetical protein
VSVMAACASGRPDGRLLVIGCAWQAHDGLVCGFPALASGSRPMLGILVGPVNPTGRRLTHRSISKATKMLYASGWPVIMRHEARWPQF